MSIEKVQDIYRRTREATDQPPESVGTTTPDQDAVIDHLLTPDPMLQQLQDLSTQHGLTSNDNLSKELRKPDLGPEAKKQLLESDPLIRQLREMAWDSKETKTGDLKKLAKQPTPGIDRDTHEFISSFFNYVPSVDSISAPSIDYTDDIAESEPFTHLVDIIAGASNSTRIGLARDVKLPFDTYDKFDANKDDHAFEITTVLKDRESVKAATRKFQDLLDLRNVTENYMDLLLGTESRNPEDARTYVEERLEAAYKKGLLTEDERDELLKKFDSANTITDEELSAIARISDVPVIGPRQNETVATIRKRWARDGVFGAKVRTREQRQQVAYVTVHGTGGALPNPNSIPDLWNARRGPRNGGRQGTEGGVGLFHYLVSQDGKIYELINPVTHYCYHDHRGDQAPYSIGIEMENLGRGKNENTGTYTAAQYESLAWLIGTYLIALFPSIKEIRSHRCMSAYLAEFKKSVTGLAEDGKNCPGRNFSWSTLSNALSELYGVTASVIGPYDQLSVTVPAAIAELKERITFVNHTMNLEGGFNSSIDRTIGKLLTREIFDSLYRFYLNDLTGKVEDIQIQLIPGTSTYIPLAGENAPVVQSTGGRQCNVQIKTTVTHPADLAKLALMFKVNDKFDNLVSMLMAARSAFKGAEARGRLRYLTEYAEQEQFRHSLDVISGKRILPRLDEPVRIKNDVLNGLGLKTFVPVSMEVKSHPDVADAYEVLLGFTYINLGNRYLESLKQYKNGSNMPVLPMTAQLGAMRETTKEDYKSTDDKELDLIGKLSFLSFRKGLSEFLPLYCMSRIETICKALSGPEVSDIDIGEIGDLLSISMDQTLWTGFDRLASLEDIMSSGKTLRIIAGTLGNIATDVTELLAGITASLATGKLSSNTLRSARDTVSAVTDAAGKGKKAGKVVSLMEQVRAKARGLSDQQKKFVAGMAGGGVASIGASLGWNELTDSQDISTIDFNIAALMPYLVFDLVRDYVKALQFNKVDDFILSIANNAYSLISRGRAVERRGIGSALRIVLPQGNISILRQGEHVRDVAGIDIYFLLMGVNEARTIASIGDSSAKIATGIMKVRSDLVGAIRRIAGQGDDVLVKRMPELSSLILRLYAVQSVADVTSLNDVSSLMGGNRITEARMPVSIANFSRSASILAMSGSARRHAAELCATLVTTSYLDKLAISTIRGSGKLRGKGNHYYRRIEDMVGASTYDLWISAFDNFTTSLTLAEREIEDGKLQGPLVSGMFVANSFTNGALRNGFCHALLYNVGLVEDIASGTPGRSFSSPFGAPTLHDIVGAVEPSLVTIVAQTAVMLGAAVLSAINEIKAWLLADLAVTGLAAAIGGPIGAAVGAIVNRIIMIFTMITVVGMFLTQKAVKVVLGTGNLFILSQWLANRVRDGLDQSLFLRACLETGIWYPDAVTFGADAGDELNTTYVDYPVIMYQGTPLMPDFYVYKVGFVQQSFSELVGQIQDMLAIVQERTDKTDDLDYGTLMKELNERLNEGRDEIVRIGELELSSLITDATDDARVYFNIDTIGKLSRSRQRRIKSDIEGIGSDINEVISGNRKLRLVYLRIKKEGEELDESSSDKELRKEAPIHIFVNEHGKCKITVRDIFWTVVQETEAYSALTDTEGIGERIASRTAGSDLKSTIFTEIVSSICRMVTDLVSMQRGQLAGISDTMPDTIRNVMMAKYLVGSSMRAIGKPGANILRSQLEEIGRAHIQKSLAFNTGYIYPTVRLFFIEEDNEAWYLFDDVYSYASIVSFKVHMDRTSPIRTLKLDVTNLYGKLDNVMSDMVNMEANFLHDPDQSLPLNSVMLRVGCKIKIQAGNTPILTEENTVFTGRITAITPGPITSIEAQSGGDVLMEDISTNAVQVYGPAAHLSKSLIRRTWTNAKTAIAGFFGYKNYNRPIDCIRDVIGNVLADVTAKSSLDDYAINPEFTTEYDQEITISTNDLSKAIKDKLFPNAMEFFLRQAGADVNVDINMQLLENVFIEGDKTMRRYISIPGVDGTEGAWVSHMETAWDTLNEINLLLPNNVLTVRPYDTRSTLVWTHQDGFYRRRRKVDLSSMNSSMVMKKVLPMIRSGNKFSGIIKHYLDARSGSEEIRVGASALLVLIAYHAQRIWEAYYAANGGTTKRIKEDYLIRLSDTSSLTKALKWLTRYISLEELDREHEAVLKAYSLAIPRSSEIRLNGGDINFKVSEISDELSDTSSNKKVKSLVKSGQVDFHVITHLALEQASEFYLDHFLDIVAARSSSHRRVSDYHIKLSGRDIVANEMQLLEPYNTVKIAYTTDYEADPEEIVKETYERNAITVPVHYKLKPWAIKAYASYFKNSNVFPCSRTSVISMASLSILTNLLKETYGGSITLLGDPSIFENDRILVWDETRDLFGIVGVRSHTFMFSQQEGCLSVIEPDMQVRNEYMLESSVLDMALWNISVIRNIVLAGIGIAGAIGGFRMMKRAMAYGPQRNSVLAKKVTGLLGNVDRVLQAPKLVFNAFTHRKSVWDALRKAQGGKWVSEAADELVAARMGIEDAITNKEGLVQIQKILNDELGKAGLSKIDDLDVIEDALNRINSKIFQDQNTAGLLTRTWSRVRGRPGTVVLPDLDARVAHFMNEAVLELARKSGKGVLNEARIAEEVAKHIETSVSPHARKAMDVVDGLKKLEPESLGLSNISKEEFAATIDDMVNDVIYHNASFKRVLTTVAKTGAAIVTADMLLKTTREIADLYLVNGMTADNIVVSPMFYRGEPYVAGLDGMVKGDANPGFAAIMGARFAQFGESIEHAFSDPWQNTLYDAMIRYRQTTGQITKPQE